MLVSRLQTAISAIATGPLALALVILLAALSGCDNAQTGNPAAVDVEAPPQTDANPSGNSAIAADMPAVEAASADLAVALERTFEEARPITGQDELASRLGLPAARLETFTPAAGSTAGSTSSTEPAALARNDFWCSGRGCICIGDSDCNDMFSTVCRNPSTGGECRVTGRLVVCTCTLARQS